MKCKIFLLYIEQKEETLEDLTFLCVYLTKHNLVNGDKIIITENELIKRLVQEGKTIEESNSMINELCSVDIKMIDDGKETDSFFIHF